MDISPPVGVPWLGYPQKTELFSAGGRWFESSRAEARLVRRTGEAGPLQIQEADRGGERECQDDCRGEVSVAVVVVCLRVDGTLVPILILLTLSLTLQAPQTPSDLPL